VNPLVSIVVAAWNEERHLGECLAALQAQTYAPVEILVVDDGSTDGTAALAESVAGVRVLCRPHSGHGRSLNAGAREARGDVVIFLDGDLVCDPDYVERLVTPINSGEEVGTCHAAELVANPTNRWAAVWQARAGLPPDRRLVLSAADVAAGSTIYRAVRRADFLRVGGFDDVGYLDDQTLFPKLGRRARLVPEAACRHYNPERLGEVFALGTWAAHTVLHLHGRRTLLRYFPLFGLWRSVTAGVRARSATRFAYDLTHETGVWWGLLRRVARGGRRGAAAGTHGAGAGATPRGESRG
jgi:glycosyltransferase involved in cell wall biosynthesis